MMNKKLKYIEFMGDDIFKVITIEDGMISFPWMMGSLEWQYSDAGTEFEFTYDEVMNLTPYRSSHYNDNTMFEHYVITKYGAKDNEVLSVWLKVKRRLLSMLE